MPGRHELRNRVASFFELPRDVMMDLPRITLMGDVELLVENHRGLVGYEPEQVVLSLTEGRLVITGSDLTIGSVSPDQVTIQGKIRGLHYDD